MALLALLFFVVLSAGCEPPPLDISVGISPYSVEAVANANDGHVNIAIGGGSVGASGVYFVQGDVTVRGVAYPITRTTGCGANACFVADARHLDPGDRMDMHLVINDTTSVSGSATVLAAPNITSPRDVRLVIALHPAVPGVPIMIPVSWAASGVAAAQVDVRVRDPYSGNTIIPGASCPSSLLGNLLQPPNGESTGYLYDVRCRVGNAEVAWDSATVDIALSVFDASYSEYHDASKDNEILLGRASFGISGAPGVFGTVHTTTISGKLIAQ